MNATTRALLQIIASEWPPEMRLDDVAFAAGLGEELSAELRSQFGTATLTDLVRPSFP